MPHPLRAAALASLLMVAPAALSQPTAAPEIAAALPQIDRQFADFMLDARIPGLVYGIVADGRLVHVKALGVQDLETRTPVTADSLFRIASMSKAFTALAILDLRDQGKLALDAPAETYVPQMRGWKPATLDSPRITVADLLHHTAGFVTDDPWGDRQTPLPEADFTSMLAAGVPFTRPTRTAFEYSNFGYATLGRIVTNVSGRNFADTIEATLLKPLGMAASGYDITRAPAGRRALGYRWENGRWSREPDMGPGSFGAAGVGSFGAMGGLQTSANDYARYVAWLLSAWPAGGGSEAGPMKRASIRELAQGNGFPQSRTRAGKSGATACKIASIYGKGMIAGQDCDLGATLSHGGGYPGYGSHLLLLPDSGIGIFAFTNRTYGGAGGPVWDAAVALHKAGALKPAAVPTSAALTAAAGAAARMFSAGSISGESAFLAMNFTMDRSADTWAAEFARLKAESGRCDTTAPVVASGALSGSFSWRCETARVNGQLLLAPTASPQIQALRLTVTAP